MGISYLMGIDPSSPLSSVMELALVTHQSALNFLIHCLLFPVLAINLTLHALACIRTCARASDMLLEFNQISKQILVCLQFHYYMSHGISLLCHGVFNLPLKSTYDINFKVFVVSTVHTCVSFCCPLLLVGILTQPSEACHYFSECEHSGIYCKVE